MVNYNKPEAPVKGECWVCHQACNHNSVLCLKHSRIIRKRATRIKRRSQDPKAKARATENNVKRSLNAGIVLPESTEAFYENYKEPLKAVENGYGYMGTLATNEARTHVQCHICGKFYIGLSAHIAMHKTTAKEYKKEYGLAQSTALIGEELRNKHLASASLRFNGKLPEHLIRYNQDVQEGRIKRRATNRNGGQTLERRNKEGTCPDQTLAVIKEFAEKIGHTPSHDEFAAAHTRYGGPIRTHFGGWENALRMAGLVPIGDVRKQVTSREMLVEYLKDFYGRNKRVPMNTDFKRQIVVSRYTYLTEFGTLNNARLAAGIPAIIPMPFGKYMELPAEEWGQYQEMVDQQPSSDKRYASRGREQLAKLLSVELKEMGAY